MCSRAGARSVASHAPLSPPPHRRRRSHGGGAGRRPRAQPPTPSTAAPPQPAIRSSSRPIQARPKLRVDRHLLARRLRRRQWLPGASDADARRARRRASARARASCSCRATPRAASRARSSPRVDLGAAVAAISRRDRGQAQAGRATRHALGDRQDHRQGDRRDTTSCQTGTLRWAATRAPATSTAASTSQERAVVVRLDAARKRVNDVITDLAGAPCTPDGFFRVPDHFGKLPGQDARAPSAIRSATTSRSTPAASAIFDYRSPGA